MKKILFTATVDSHILTFHLPYLKWFKDQGIEVHVASNGDANIPFVDKKYNIPIERSPFKKANLKALNSFKEIINCNDYHMIHCHTPMGSVLTRLAARKAQKNGTKVIYTAHGFHFYNGAPLLNWLMYYPVERWLSKYTDCLITINNEDFQTSNRLHSKALELVNGIGVDLNKFVPQTVKSKYELRKKYNFNEGDFILIFVGELNYNKHQDLLINVMYLLSKKYSNIKLLLVGDGDYFGNYKEQVNKLHLQEFVLFLGYRNDIRDLLLLSDVSVSSSRREGLPVNVMEAMATGLPLVATNCRGNRDLVMNEKNGFLIGINDIDGFSIAIEKLYQSQTLRETFGINSLEHIHKYSLETIKKKMQKIYTDFID
ncbi:glycosyltransferase family 4 protein [Heyndrickxia oleronia]|uniref:glycosyltransferase family 4 protein n=1 Tax=Heyndrickxia oleronia TaxID=38875 RepID=UPI002040DEF5|nr:glycosyltransferase family 4 protein [Heyndrickxia oleronia]MCM3453726.1 glycosyltransferase family 4 protein [Heyndrickxia oleronia]